jgi:hypothetical protein
MRPRQLILLAQPVPVPGPVTQALPRREKAFALSHRCGRRWPSKTSFCKRGPKSLAREPTSPECLCTRSPESWQLIGPRRCPPRLRHVQSPARITACLAWFSIKHIGLCLLVALRWSLTPRSSGVPTAGHQARAGGTLYIFASPGLASYRRRPLSSNVRPHRTKTLSPPPEFNPQGEQ